MCEVLEIVAPGMAVPLDAELGDVVGVVDIEGEAAVFEAAVGEDAIAVVEPLGLGDVDPEFVE